MSVCVCAHKECLAVSVPVPHSVARGSCGRQEVRSILRGPGLTFVPLSYPQSCGRGQQGTRGDRQGACGSARSLLGSALTSGNWVRP